MQIFQNIDTFLQSNNSHINFACGNSGSTNLAKNLAISASQCNTKIVFFALDKASIKEMKNYCDIVDASSLGFGINEDFLKYRTSEFNAISFARYHIAESILNAGKSLTYIDIDCVVKNNFESDILSKLKTQPEHLHIQVNLKNKPCTGFFALTPAFDSFILNQFIIQQKPRDHDQHFLWNAVSCCSFDDR